VKKGKGSTIAEALRDRDGDVMKLPEYNCHSANCFDAKAVSQG
jgi:hypothetical protein